ncbi:MAG: small multi-drug export protein [Candidatus Omnitrophota bacterium]
MVGVDEFKVIGTAALPIFELRGAIPLGFALGVPLTRLYFLVLLGNLIPVLPLLLFFKYSFHHLENIKFLDKFFKWWFSKVEERSKLVERWRFWGLILFVAIPLPITGAWTGTVAATLFEIPVRRAFLAIFLGVAVAGLIVSLAVSGIVQLWFTP